jgi:hypothetical protein
MMDRLRSATGCIFWCGFLVQFRMDRLRFAWGKPHAKRR